MVEVKLAGAARLPAIDGLRGVLTAVVVAWHVAPVAYVGLLMLANIAVGAFFVLSGYVLTRGWDGRPLSFMARRIIRLWPVYALCLAAGYGLAAVHPVWSEWLWYPWLGPNASPQIDPPAWSLFLEVWTIPFMPLIVWAGSGPFVRAVACMAALMAASVMVPQICVGALFIAGAFFSRRALRARLLEAPAIQFLGRISYSVYLSHWLVITAARRLLGPWGGIMALPVVVLVGWAVWRWVERPSVQASRLLRRRAGGAAAQQGEVVTAA